MSCEKDIIKARQSLRDIHKKYSKELFEIITKIDRALEILQGQQNED